MGKRVFIIGLVFVSLSLQSLASVTIEQSTDAEYLMNQGYSEITAEDVFMLKNRATGKPVEPMYGRDPNVFAKGWNAFWSYIDPARDRNDRLHHDIKVQPSATDL